MFEDLAVYDIQYTGSCKSARPLSMFENRENLSCIFVDRWTFEVQRVTIRCAHSPWHPSTHITIISQLEQNGEGGKERQSGSSSAAVVQHDSSTTRRF